MISIRPHKLFIYAITACIACIPSFGSPAGKNNDWIDEIDSYVNSNPDSAIILCNDAIREHYPLDGSEKVALLTIRGNANFTLEIMTQQRQISGKRQTLPSISPTRWLILTPFQI